MTFFGRPVFDPFFRECMLPVLVSLDAFAASPFGQPSLSGRQHE